VKQNTPKFLEHISEKILLTGKYLNAINETGKNLIRIQKENEPITLLTSNALNITIPNAKEIVFTIKEEIYKQIVDISYNFSSKVLLNLLLHDHKLIDRLRLFSKQKHMNFFHP
jgi:gamma-tubulin complex component 2